jgi:hypothetical protein
MNVGLIPEKFLNKYLVHYGDTRYAQLALKLAYNHL